MSSKTTVSHGSPPKTPLRVSVEEADSFEGRAVLEVGPRVVEVRYQRYSSTELDLDGSECVEIFDASEAPQGATTVDGWPGCLAFPGLLSAAERDAIETALYQWHIEDDADLPEPDELRMIGGGR